MFYEWDQKATKYYLAVYSLVSRIHHMVKIECNCAGRIANLQIKNLGMLECVSTCLQILSLLKLCFFLSFFQFAPNILEEFLPFLDYMTRDQYILWPHSAAPCTSPSSRPVSPRRARVSLCCSCGRRCGEPSWACWITTSGTALFSSMTQTEVSCDPALSSSSF